MESERSSHGPRKSDSTHNLSVNAHIFREWRSPQAEELELSMWTLKMLESAVALDYEQYGVLKTAIQRGVPDILKPYVWIKANEADKFYKNHPNFYETCLESTFGNHMPVTLSEQCPTFCGGLMGFERDLHEQSDSNLIYETESSTQEHQSGFTSDMDDVKCLSGIPESEIKRDDGIIYKHDFLQCDDEKSLKDKSGNIDFPSSSNTSLSSISPLKGNVDDRGSEYRSSEANFLGSDSNKDTYVPKNVFRMKGPERMREMSNIFISRESSISTTPKRSFIKNLFKNRKMGQNLRGLDRRHLSEPLIKISGKYNLPPLAVHLSHLQHKTFETGENNDAENNDPLYYGNTESSVAKSEGYSFSNSSVYNNSVQESENDNIKKMLWFSKLARIDSDSDLKGRSRKCGNFLKKFYRIFCCKSHDSHGELSIRIDENFENNNLDLSAYNEPLNTDSPEIDKDNSHEPESSEAVSGQQKFLQIVATREKVQQNTTTSAYNIQDVTDFCILLTPNGIEQVKRILWCLNTSFSSKVEYMPMIPTLCCVLLVYLIPEVVLCVLYKLLKRATDKKNGHFIACTRTDFINLVKMCYSKAKSFNTATTLYLEKLGVDLLAWISRVIQRGFTFILPFDHILRILGAYLFQGDEVLCRYILSVLRLLQPDILKCSDKESADQVLYYAGLRSNPNLDEITKIAYSFRLSLRKRNKAEQIDIDKQTNYLKPIGIKLFYRPRLNHKSTIIEIREWEELWTWIGDSYRILDPDILYCSSTDGYNIYSLIKKFETIDINTVPALLFIQTCALDVIGLFIPQLSKYPKDGVYTQDELDSESFVFTCRPSFRVYQWENKGGPILNQDGIKVGSNGFALYVDKNLHSGYSNASTTYNSPPLVNEYSGHFYIAILELWILT